jgi:hypothetical protein
MNRQPFIVGPVADNVLGLVAGVFGTVLGLVATIVVMYVWAGSDPDFDTRARRRHAAQVSVWAAVGCVVPFILFLLFLMAVSSSGGRLP